MADGCRRVIETTAFCQPDTPVPLDGFWPARLLLQSGAVEAVRNHLVEQRLIPHHESVPWGWIPPFSFLKTSVTIKSTRVAGNRQRSIHPVEPTEPVERYQALWYAGGIVDGRSRTN